MQYHKYYIIYSDSKNPKINHLIRNKTIRSRHHTKRWNMTVVCARAWPSGESYTYFVLLTHCPENNFLAFPSSFVLRPPSWSTYQPCLLLILPRLSTFNSPFPTIIPMKIAPTYAPSVLTLRFVCESPRGKCTPFSDRCVNKQSCIARGEVILECDSWM